MIEKTPSFYGPTYCMFKSSITSWFLRSVFLGGKGLLPWRKATPMSKDSTGQTGIAWSASAVLAQGRECFTVHAAEELRKLMVLLIDYHPPDEHDKPAMSIMSRGLEDEFPQ